MSSTNHRSDDISVASLVHVVHRWRKTLATFVFGVAVLTAVALILTPNTYTARANFRPESGQEVLGGLQQFLSAQLGPIGGKLGKDSGNPLDDFLVLLEGRQLAGQVVDELDLVAVYEIDEPNARVARAKAIERLRENTSSKVTDQFTVSFAANDHSPDRAAEIVSSYLVALGRANRFFAQQQASGLRTFLEQQLEEANGDLHRSLDSLQAFQVAHGTADMVEQSKVTVEVVGQLQGELVALETKRDALSTFRTGDHTQIRQLDARIDALRSRLSDLTAGVDAAPHVPDDGDNPGALLSLGDVPELARRHALLLLDVEVKKNVFSLLTSQYEQARIDEAKNTETIRVLDPPVVPHEKSAPRRTLTVLAAVIAAFLVGLVFVFGFDRLVDPALTTERGRVRFLNRRLKSEWVRWAH